MILPGELRIMSRAPIHEVVAALESRVKGANDWHRDREAEERVGKRVNAPMYCFACSEAPRRRPAGLWLAQNKKDEVYVSNIVPAVASSLSPEEYNAILEDFYHRFVEGLVIEGGFQSELITGNLQLEHWLSPTTAKLLMQFSAIANRSTGAAHPSDQERWFMFVLAAHKEATSFDAGLLGEWLKQDGWPDDTALDLAIQYEAERSLLAFYDRSR